MKLNLSSSGLLIRNFIFLFVGNIGVRALSFFIMLIVARRLGTGDFGRLNYAQAFIIYFVLIAEFGISTVSIREFSENREEISTFLGKIMGARLALGAVSVTLLLLAVLAINRPPEDKILILLSGLTIPSVTFSLDWIYRAMEDMAPIAISSILRTLLTLTLIGLFVYSEKDIFLIPLFTAVGGFGQIIFYWYQFSRRFGWPAFHFDTSYIQHLLRTTFVLGVSYLMIQIYYNVDTLLLGTFRTDEEVGLYSAAYRLALIFTAVAGLVGETIFPRLTRLTTGSSRGEVMYLGARIMIYTSLPVVLTGSLFSQQIIGFLYTPEYADSSQVLTILIWQVFTVFTNLSFAYNLLAINQQKPYLYSVTAGAMINLALNIVIIPRYGMIGASVTTMIAEVAVLILLYWYAYRLIARQSILVPLLKASLAAIAFTLVSLNARSLYSGVPLSLLAYTGVLMLVSPFTREEYRRMIPWRI